MSNIVILDNVEHHDLKVRPDRGAAFGDNVNQALVFPNEFQELMFSYPIVFRKDAEGAFQAVALLGLDRDENLFLNGTDWDADYIPATLARGPFSIGLQRPAGNDTQQPEAKVQIDLDNEAVNKTDGHAVFLPQGGNSPYLEHVIGVLRTLHDGVALTKDFFSVLEELQLIEPVTLEIKISDTRQYSVPGVYSISQENFSALPAEALHRLHTSGVLAACHWVIASLRNIRILVDRKTRRPRA